MTRITNNHDSLERADLLLAAAFSQYSRAALAKLFDAQLVRGKDKVLRAGDKLKPGEFFTVDISPLTKPADNIDLPILYEDDDVVVIEKPSGVISHARGRYWDEPSVASFVRSRLSGLEGERAGIVHRLDRATSGVMVCAKHAAALKYLQTQFSKRTVEKTYVAIVSGQVKPRAAIIDVPLARNPRDPKTFRPDAAGKSAQTAYSVLESNDSYNLVNLTPFTGRTHQLRVHMTYIHHPIVGDELYGGESADRLYLHAESLKLRLPSGEERVFRSDMRSSFGEKMNR